MATQLDLQEQEQIDELKAIWNQYGNLITWTLTLALLAYAGWMGWNFYQREQSAKASAMYDELDRAAAAGDADKVARVFADLKERFPRTTYAPQGAMQAAKTQFDKGQADAAQASLAWVVDSSADAEVKDLARLRLAALLMDGKKFDEALKQLDAVKTAAYAALVSDRRGDVLLAQGKKAEAKAAFEAAYKGLDERSDYRRVVDAKLTALGGAPAAAEAASAAASGAAK
jgi:predicted negative regulator of RcsB-dependent stress response